MKILLLEDDLILAESIKDLLEIENHNIVLTDNALDAEEFIINEEFDLLLLDVNVKGGVSGFTIAEELREDGNNTKIIFITALTDLESLKRGYDIGITDYLKKPFNPMELIFKLETIEKKKKFKTKIIYKHIEYDLSGEEILVHNKTYKLSKMEKIVFDELIENIGVTISKDTLHELINNTNDISLRVIINKLKTKLLLEIINIRGIGYKIEKR